MTSQFGDSQLGDVKSATGVSQFGERKIYVRMLSGNCLGLYMPSTPLPLSGAS